MKTFKPVRALCITGLAAAIVTGSAGWAPLQASERDPYLAPDGWVDPERVAPWYKEPVRVVHECQKSKICSQEELQSCQAGTFVTYSAGGNDVYATGFIRGASHYYFEVNLLKEGKKYTPPDNTFLRTEIKPVPTNAKDTDQTVFVTEKLNLRNGNTKREYGFNLYASNAAGAACAVSTAVLLETPSMDVRYGSSRLLSGSKALLWSQTTLDYWQYPWKPVESL